MNIRELLATHGHVEAHPKTQEQKILAIIKSRRGGAGFGLIKNRFRNKSDDCLLDAMQNLVDEGLVYHTNEAHPITGRVAVMFHATKKETTE